MNWTPRETNLLGTLTTENTNTVTLNYSLMPAATYLICRRLLTAWATICCIKKENRKKLFVTVKATFLAECNSNPRCFFSYQGKKHVEWFYTHVLYAETIPSYHVPKTIEKVWTKTKFARMPYQTCYQRRAEINSFLQTTPIYFSASSRDSCAFIFQTKLRAGELFV